MSSIEEDSQREEFDDEVNEPVDNQKMGAEVVNKKQPISE